ncbi:hypothetical protein Tco_0307591 [Tanacetum coccineum]
MDFYELELMGDILSIGVQIDEVGRMYAYLNYQRCMRKTQQGAVSCCLELSVGEEELLTLELMEKHFVGGGRGQSCHNWTPFSLGTRPEVYGFNYQLGSLVVNMISLRLSRVSHQNARIPFFFHLIQISPSLHAIAIASAQKNKGSLEAESIVRAASMRVRFRLSTTPLCSGVRGVEV